MNSPLSPTEPSSPTIFDVVKNMDDIPELGSDDDLDDNDEAGLEQPTITEEPEELEKVDDHPINEQISRGATATVTQHQDSFDTLPLDIRQFYRNKSVLVTGATGFVGKALLYKLLHSLHQEIDQIYLLIRLGPSHRRLFNPTIRLQEEILSNKVKWIDCCHVFSLTTKWYGYRHSSAYDDKWDLQYSINSSRKKSSLSMGTYWRTISASRQRTVKHLSDTPM